MKDLFPQTIDRKQIVRERDAARHWGKIKVDIHFAPREIEFINLRYQQNLSYKEISGIMGIAMRTVSYYSQRVYLLLGCGGEGNQGEDANALRAVKELIALGFISVENEVCKIEQPKLALKG